MPCIHSKIREHNEKGAHEGTGAESVASKVMQASVAEFRNQLIVAENALNSQGLSSTEVPSAFARKDFAGWKEATSNIWFRRRSCRLEKLHAHIEVYRLLTVTVAEATTDVIVEETQLRFSTVVVVCVHGLSEHFRWHRPL